MIWVKNSVLEEAFQVVFMTFFFKTILYDKPRDNTPQKLDYNRSKDNQTVNETRPSGTAQRYHKQPSIEYKSIQSSKNQPRSRSQSIDSISPFHNNKFVDFDSGHKRVKTSGTPSLVNNGSHRNFKNFVHLVDIALSEHNTKALEHQNQRCPFQEANSKLQNIFIFGKQTPKSVEEDMNMYTKINDKLDPDVEDSQIWLGANAKVGEIIDCEKTFQKPTMVIQVYES